MIHDHHVWLKGFDRAPNDALAERHEILVGDVQEARPARPVGLLAQRREGDIVHSRRHRERAYLPRLRDHDDDRLGVGAEQGLGD